MTPQDPLDALRRAWQTDDGPTATPTLEEIRGRADRTRRGVGQRNLREYLAGAFVALFFSADIMRGGFNGLVDVGEALLVVATGYVSYRLWRYGRSRTLPAELGAVDALTFYRSELVRQRDLLRNVWRWYLLPFVPGFVVTIAGRAIQQHAPWPRVGGVTALVCGMTWVVWWMNQRAAARVQRWIDQLDRPEALPLLVSPQPSLVERLALWAIYSSALTGVIGVTLTLLGVDTAALVPGLDTLSQRARRFVWLAFTFAVCLGAQGAWWAIRGRKKP